MRKKATFLIFLAGLLFSSVAYAYEPGDLLDRVIQVLERRYFDDRFRKQDLQDLAEFVRPVARAAGSFDEERRIVHYFLSKIPTSHLALVSSSSHRGLIGELRNRERVTFGLGLVELDGKYFVSRVLEGGPADLAGLLRWDRVLRVDGAPTGSSERLDWRSDDAYLPDPPTHSLLCDPGDETTLVVERNPGELRSIRIQASPYSAFRAAEASARIIHRGGKRLGYIHFWYMHYGGLSNLLLSKIKRQFADCDGLILDIRGRGGSPVAVTTVLSTLDWARRNWGRPVIALIDGGTRSAKEILAYEMKRQGLARVVGMPTPGAVIPATFQEIGHGAVLMFPAFSLGRYTDLLEGVGVEPDVYAVDSGPYSAGSDPIFEAAVHLLIAPRKRAV